MTWFKVDDSFHSHPKVIATDPAALGLWVVAGAWCSANLTNGLVPDHVLPRLSPGAAKLASKLVAAGLWERNGAGYRFHDWSDFNPTADKVLAERQAAAERKRRSREKHRHGVTDAVSHGVTDGVTHSSPTRPDPTRSGNSGGVANATQPSTAAAPPVDNHAREPPPWRCPRHTDAPAAGNCGPCGDYRHTRQDWERQQREQHQAQQHQAATARRSTPLCRRCGTRHTGDCPDRGGRP